MYRSTWSRSSCLFVCTLPWVPSCSVCCLSLMAASLPFLSPLLHLLSFLPACMTNSTEIPDCGRPKPAAPPPAFSWQDGSCLTFNRECFARQLGLGENRRGERWKLDPAYSTVKGPTAATSGLLFGPTPQRSGTRRRFHGKLRERVTERKVTVVLSEHDSALLNANTGAAKTCVIY